MVDMTAALDVQQEETEVNPLAQRRARREAVAAEVTSQEVAEQAYQEAREAELGKTITLEDITKSFTLQKLGAEPGDRIKDNELVRIFSDEDDVIDIEEVITQEAIDNSATLQSLGAVAGDLVIKKDG